MDKKDALNRLYIQYRKEYEGNEIVVGDGQPNSKLILVGEAPGKDEVRLQKPFVGIAGKNLDEFLKILELRREDIFITNAIKYRLSKVNPKTGLMVNRPASKKEIETNRKYLLKEISIIEPKYIITLGNVPLKSVADDGNTIGRAHGQLKTIFIECKGYKLFPLYHPASIIYNRSLKETYISDLNKLKEVLQS
ncbi:MAG: uracil-DNA glycosylase [Acetivibrionales bacterium]